MKDALGPIARHVNQILSQQARPLYLAVDTRFRLIALRGKATHFGLPTISEGAAMDELLPMLAGLDPSDNKPQMWRFMQLPHSPVCHVHVVRTDNGWAVALLDAGAEHQEQLARQQAAHELALLRGEREKLLEELRQSDRLKGEFIARMSHEFRTPLSSVIGYSGELRTYCADDIEALHHIDAIARGGRYLLNLVENLLDQAKIEIDQLRLNPGGCDVHELSNEIEQLLRPLAEQKQLSLAWWFDGTIPPRVWIDASRLQQILINLVGNAIKFTREGGVNVEFEWWRNRLHVAVTDTGPGIKPEDVDAIFEPYHQGDSGRQSKGAGLGLAISRSLVRAMGGDISVGDNDDRGSRFEFSIDAATVPTGGTASPDSLAGCKVLLADDDPDLLELFGLYLKAAGCTVQSAADARSTLETVRRFKPDMIVIDLNLGDTKGSDVARKLRKSGYRKRIALLSASSPEITADSAKNGLFDACWYKPISRADLLEGLAGLIK